LQEKHLADRRNQLFICSSARLASPSGKKWKEEFLAKVKEEGKKDEEYKRTMEQEAASEGLAPEDRKARDIKKENGVLYRRGLLWVP